MVNIVIIGSGGHAKVLIDVIRKSGCYHLNGLIDPIRYPGETTLGFPVLGNEEHLSKIMFDYGIKGIVVGIGDNFLRSSIASRIGTSLPGVSFFSLVHPDTSIGQDVEIGAGSVILAGARVGPGCKIGRFCILNSNSSLDHDSHMEDFSSLAPGSTTGGNCRIGKCAAICIGANVSHGVIIGEHAVIGAGATVLRDIAPYKLAFGVPAKEQRKRIPGERYL